MVAEDSRIILPISDDKLLELCRVETFRSSGKGGQHVNTTDSAVRLTFLPCRIVVTCQKERSQYWNKRECLKKLREKVDKLNHRDPKRIPTKISKRKKAENLNRKNLHGQKKLLRKKIDSSQEFSGH